VHVETVSSFCGGCTVFSLFLQSFQTVQTCARLYFVKKVFRHVDAISSFCAVFRLFQAVSDCAQIVSSFCAVLQSFQAVSSVFSLFLRSVEAVQTVQTCRGCAVFRLFHIE
jgi:hypothetical protein